VSVRGTLLALGVTAAFGGGVAIVWADSRPYAMPNPVFTPGMVATSDPAVLCEHPEQPGSSYSRQHRHTTYEMKEQVAYNYSLPRRDWHTVEFDHLIPLCLGGADDVRNIWPQPLGEARIKDRAEAGACRMMCEQHLDTQQISYLQHAFMDDWRMAYKIVLGSEP
jgi:hypothetical protein